MADLENIEHLRKKRARIGFLKKALALLLIVAAIALAVAFRHEISRLNLVEQLTSHLVGIGSGPGWPVDISGITVREMAPMGNDLAVLTDTDLIFYSAQGREIRRVQHGCANPVMKVGGTRVLLYDTGSREIRVESKTRTVGSKTMEYAVDTGDISANNCVVLVTQGARYASEVTVLDKNLAQLYQWRSADSRVMVAALSDQQDEMAVGTVNVRDGQLYSTLLLFRFDEEQEYVREELAGELIHSLRYKQGCLQALSSRRLLTFSETGKRMAEYSLGEETLTAFDSGAELFTTLLVGDYREFKELDLAIVDYTGAAVGGSQLDFQVEDSTAAGDRVVLQSGGTLYLYGGGALLDEMAPLMEILDIQLVGKNLYLLTPSTLEKITVR
ncbi:MAG: DUF5711 family protein [Oscillospiraceae bacterium]|nr:DUF5711 family protein [Oscillospiraceae bacterium]